MENLEPIEQSIIGVLLNNNNIILNNLLDSKYFNNTHHKTIILSMMDCIKDHGKVDILLIRKYLPQDSRIIEYIEELSQYNNLYNYELHYKQLIQEYQANQFKNLLNNTIENSNNTNSYEELATLRNELIQNLQDITLVIDDKLKNNIDDVFSIINNNNNFIKTKPRLNTALGGGLLKKELVIIAGATGMGKTTVAIDLLCEFVKNDYNTLFYTIEMSKPELYTKIANNLLNNFNKKFSNDEVIKIKKLCKNLIIKDDGKTSLDDIKNNIRQYKKDYKKLDIVFIDYLQIMKRTNYKQSEYEFISQATTGLKQLAMEEDVLIILLSQLNRNNRSRDEKRPTVADLRGSGSIEQDANIILLLHREEYYLKEQGETIPKEIENIIEINLSKFRRGEPQKMIFKSILGKSQLLDLSNEEKTNYITTINKN